MKTTLVMIGGAFLLVWSAMFTCALSDRLRSRGRQTFSAPEQISPVPASFSSYPVWKQLLAIPLFIGILPVLVPILTIIVIPLGIWSGTVWAYYKVRQVLTGKPMPTYELPV